MKKYFVMLVMMFAVSTVAKAQMVYYSNGYHVGFTFDMGLTVIEVPSEAVPFANYLHTEDIYPLVIHRYAMERYREISRYNGAIFAAIEVGKEVSKATRLAAALKAQLSSAKAAKKAKKAAKEVAKADKSTAQSYTPKRVAEAQPQPADTVNNYNPDDDFDASSGF